MTAAGWLFCTLLSCNDIRKNQAHRDTLDESILQGKQLAAVYCQSCHLLPDPGLLDTRTWEKGVLPHMGPLLGILEHQYQRYSFNGNDLNLNKGYYPSRPLVTPRQWQHILDYYMATSPDSLPGQVRDQPVSKQTTLFNAQLPAFAYDNPCTSLISIDTALHQLVSCDVVKQTVYRFNGDLQLLDSLWPAGRYVDMHVGAEGMLACNIGIFEPTNARYGKVQYIRNDPAGRMRADSLPLFDRLQRPVQVTPADLDNDGKMDYVVCEFGYLAGALSWMKNLGGTFEHRVIKPVPGAVKVIVRDENRDGLPDLWVLFAQGDEGISLFTNKGGGGFEQQVMLRFPPSYGSSSFELADFDHDGHPDIVYTCGDNADYSTVLKPYHGVYVFMNDGKNRFDQQYFYPVNGCYKSVARDFDNDGDLDMATIAFFADYQRQPEESLLYFENTGKTTFTPAALPHAANGRWITMDAGDIDGDGKTDLVLGNFSLGPMMMPSPFKWEKGPPFMVLRNTGKR